MEATGTMETTPKLSAGIQRREVMVKNKKDKLNQWAMRLVRKVPSYITVNPDNSFNFEWQGEWHKNVKNEMVACIIMLGKNLIGMEIEFINGDSVLFPTEIGKVLKVNKRTLKIEDNFEHVYNIKIEDVIFIYAHYPTKK